jgi:hypothetical protein
MKNTVNVLTVILLAIGGVFGMAGTFVTQRNIQAAAWAIDGVALVVATTFLALKFFRAGNDFAAAGFLVFSVGESVMLVGTATSIADSIPSFGAGTALWSAALLLTSIPREFALWTRVVAVIGAALFAVTSARIFWGDQIFPTSRPLPFYAYPFLVLTFVGWILKLLKAS